MKPSKVAMFIHAGIWVTILLTGCQNDVVQAPPTTSTTTSIRPPPVYGGFSDPAYFDPNYMNIPSGPNSDRSEILAINSNILNRKIRVTIHLPSSYLSQPSKLFPVVYETDGQWMQFNYPNVDARGYQVIVVGVWSQDRITWNSTRDFETRAYDFNWPGCQNYFEFFTQEMMPEVESNYRVDTSRRTLAGGSFGGVFSTLGLLLDQQNETQLFDSFISMEGAFFDNFYPSWTAIQSRLATLHETTGGVLPRNATIVFSGDLQANYSFVNNAVGLFHSKGFENLTIHHLADTNLGHDSMASTAFPDSIELLIGPDDILVP